MTMGAQIVSSSPSRTFSAGPREGLGVIISYGIPGFRSSIGCLVRFQCRFLWHRRQPGQPGHGRGKCGGVPKVRRESSSSRFFSEHDWNKHLSSYPAAVVFVFVADDGILISACCISRLRELDFFVHFHRPQAASADRQGRGCQWDGQLVPGKETVAFSHLGPACLMCKPVDACPPVGVYICEARRGRMPS
jgi:hypothetical protein